MIVKFSVYPDAAVDDVPLRRLRQLVDLPDLTRWRSYYLELLIAPSPQDVDRLCGALHDPLVERIAVDVPLESSSTVQVAHLQSIVDNENDSIVALCGVLGIDARAARVTTAYRSANPALAERISRHLVNPNIEELHTSEPQYRRLTPSGQASEARRYDLRGLSGDELLEIGAADGRNLDADKMKALQHIQRALNRPFVTDVLVEAVDSRWSDHCLHTTWRSLGNLLSRLAAASRRTNNANIVSMFGDNAGVWEFYDGWSLAIKAETHNGPSAVSAYFGQLTKVGGVLRDILGTGLGANPIGVYEYTATGCPGEDSPIPGRPSPRQVAHETVRAVKEYGNTFGVPMLASHMTFHELYRAKPFALGGSIGLIPTKHGGRGSPQPRDLLVLIGGLTGNDGIHGASSSSAGAEMDQAAVQIGSPLEQVKFRQAIVDLRDAGRLRAVTDLGGAGLNSGVGEIGDPVGVWLNTALVPLKTAALPSWIILLSESQERMLLVVAPEQWEAARRTLSRHMVRHTVVGRFTGDEHYTVVHLPELSEQDVIAADVATLPREHPSGFSVAYELLDYDPPLLVPPPPPTRRCTTSTFEALDGVALRELIVEMLGDPELASQRWADSQYDTTVQGHRFYGPTAGVRHVPTSYWAGTPLADSPAAVLLATAFDPWLFAADPVGATRQGFMAVLHSLTLAGAALEDICLCDNFYTPDLDQDGFAWLVAMVDELCDLIDVFGTPVVSGKDSSAGSVVTPEGTINVPPGVFLSAMGKVPDAKGLTPNEWQRARNVLVRIGPDTSSPCGTLATRVRGVDSESRLDRPSAEGYLDYLTAVRACREHFVSARPIGPGGTACTLAMGYLVSGLGVVLEPGGELTGLVAEHRCGALVEVSESAMGSLPAVLQPRLVGRLCEPPTRISHEGEELLSEAALSAWEQSFEAALA